MTSFMNDPLWEWSVKSPFNLDTMIFIHKIESVNETSNKFCSINNAPALGLTHIIITKCQDLIDFLILKELFQIWQGHFGLHCLIFYLTLFSLFSDTKLSFCSNIESKSSN